MHKITKDEAKEFIEKQNYQIILSTKLSNYSIDDNDYDTIYFPISKEEFIKEIREEEIIWNSEGEIVGYMEDWEQELENIIQMSEETELEFYNFCKERDIDFREWIDEIIIPHKPEVDSSQPLDVKQEGGNGVPPTLKSVGIPPKIL